MSFEVVARVVALAALACAPPDSDQTWVESIQTSDRWSSFPCEHYLVTDVCGVDKDFDDPGSLPSTISVGDVVSYSNAEGEAKEFTVRHISYFRHEKDVDSTYGGERLTAKKGDTSCFLYDAATRSATRPNEYPSKLIVKGCRVLR